MKAQSHSPAHQIVQTVISVFRTTEQIISPEMEWYSKYLLAKKLKQQKTSWEEQIIISKTASDPHEESLLYQMTSPPCSVPNSVRLLPNTESVILNCI